MKAPVKHGQGRGGKWEYPDKEWLNNQYWVQGKSARSIAKEHSTCSSMVVEWMRVAGVSTRTQAQLDKQNSEWHQINALGEDNPNWRGGQRRHYARVVLLRAGVAEKCTWCGQEPILDAGRKGTLEAHHEDHDRRNNVLGNLIWLCQACNNLESWLWNLVKQGKINLTCKGRTMVIEFK